jgi:hypothetical protein
MLLPTNVVMAIVIVVSVVIVIRAVLLLTLVGNAPLKFSLM